MTPLRIFIGYDSREPAAFAVLSHSILRHATRPVAIIPLVQAHLRAASVYTREPDPGASTEFSLTRFLVPFLSGFEGVSVFMDCDMLVRCDIWNLLDEEAKASRHEDVLACHHDYTPKCATKMDGHLQAAYPRKNWSSLMVFRNDHCRQLTPGYVNGASPADLHRFEWAERVRALPLAWNWLVGEYQKNPDAKILHYTNGGPWFRGYEDCDHAEDWFRERELMLTAPQAQAARWPRSMAIQSLSAGGA